jgi:hypothetical protein
MLSKQPVWACASRAQDATKSAGLASSKFGLVCSDHRRALQERAVPLTPYTRLTIDRGIPSGAVMAATSPCRLQCQLSAVSVTRVKL